MNTPQGGKKVRETMIKKHGSEEAWKQHMRSIGSAGGKKKNPEKGFGSMDKEKVRAAGRLGGSISRRRKPIEFDMAYEDIHSKADTKKLVYDTSNLGVDSNTVSNSGGILRRAADRVVGR